MLLLGTIVGVFLNAVSPNWLITVCLILVLSFTVYRTALKAQQVSCLHPTSQHNLQVYSTKISFSFISKKIAQMLQPPANHPL